MTDLHPHWRSTSDDADARSVSAETSTPVRVQIAPASRMPAAIVGIAIFAVIGFTFAGGWEALSAQVGGGGQSSSSAATSSASGTGVEIHIKMTGFDPASVSVNPGQTITWINDQDIPHILTSQTLRDNAGAYLNTSAIFPGSKVSFTVGAKEAPKQHKVTSTTDQTLLGTVIVTGAQATSSASSKKPLFGGTEGVNLPSGQGGISKSASSKSSSKTSSIANAGAFPSPFDPPPGQAPSQATGQSLDAFAPTGTSGNQNLPPVAMIPTAPVMPNNAPIERNFAPETPAPIEQPHTGPGVWAVTAMSVAILWGLTRRYFARVEL